MTKTAAVKGMAMQTLQPAVDVAPLTKAVLPRALRGPPAKASGLRPKATQKSVLTVAELQASIANASGLLPKDVNRLLKALGDIAAENLKNKCVFKLHNIMNIHMRKTPPGS